MESIKVEMKVRGIGMDVDRNDFALALKTWRIRKGLTQTEAGQLLGTSRYTIIRIEKAKEISWPMAYRVFARFADELRKESNQI